MRRLCCKISSANDNAPGGPVSSNSGATLRSERTTNAPVSTGKFASQNFALSRAQALNCAKTTARRILQHCTCGGRFLLFRRLGMKWALGRLLVYLAPDRGECAVVRNRDPRADRNYHANTRMIAFTFSVAFGVRGHVRALKAATCHCTPNRSRQAPAQTFSSESMIGAIAAEGVLSGGTTSGTASVEAGRICGCSTRVAMSIAVKSSAPARKYGAPGR